MREPVAPLPCLVCRGQRQHRADCPGLLGYHVTDDPGAYTVRGPTGLTLACVTTLSAARRRARLYARRPGAVLY